MKEISVVLPVTLGTNAGRQKYLPMLTVLGENLHTYYGIGFPRGYQSSEEPVHKMKLTKISSRISCFAAGPVIRLLHLPEYYRYLVNITLFDWIMCRRVKRDSSKAVFTSPLLRRTVEKCKEQGKIVIVEAGNSEPEREYERISRDYEQFGIRSKYIYGNPVYKKICSASLRQADYMINISRVSAETYSAAGYNMKKSRLIPLTGCDWPLQKKQMPGGKKRAFISTAFHSFIKGTHRLLLAYQNSRAKEIPLIITGRLCEDMREFIRKYGPFENVEFAGDQRDLYNWYKDYDAVGILMSLSEGAGRVVPEMMSFGFPMIVSYDARCDIVNDGLNGFVRDPFDEAGIIEALEYFAGDWSRVHEMREEVLQSAENRTVRDFSAELGEYLLSVKDLF